MKPSLLVIVTSDPRTSARPAEAVRIAAGVGTWRKADVTLYLRGPAIRALGEWVDDLVDEDNFTQYLPILRDFPRRVQVQAGAPELDDLGEPSLPYEPIDDAALAALAARSTAVLRF